MWICTWVIFFSIEIKTCLDAKVWNSLISAKSGWFFFCICDGKRALINSVSGRHFVQMYTLLSEFHALPLTRSAVQIGGILCRCARSATSLCRVRVQVFIQPSRLATVIKWRPQTPIKNRLDSNTWPFTQPLFPICSEWSSRSACKKLQMKKSEYT